MPPWAARGRLALICAVGLMAGPRAASARGGLERQDATGDWGGSRSWLEERGVHLDLDYGAETFTVPADQVAAYRGNLDLLITLSTERLKLWSCGTILVYGQHAHGHGVSDHLQPIVPVSNMEAPAFTQLSELWLQQCLGPSVTLRLGKQDANRDFGGPRFAGNFINASFGPSPSVPMPSFPAPGLGAAVFVDPTEWLGVRAGVYEAASTINSIGEDAFDEGAGMFAISALVLQHAVLDQPAARHQVGAWRHTGQGRGGLFGVLDILMRVKPDDAADLRSVQVFVRGGWSERSPDQVHLYAGGGLTLHGVLGRNNTAGAGAGQVRADDRRETFVELLFKLRLAPWLSFEPDAQLYFIEGDSHLALGIRGRIKL